MIFIGIIVSILLFSIIILIHELGHFGASRLFGVKVEEFGLGIPPRAKKLFTDKFGTLYSLNWLPLGGFVRLRGENINLLENKNDKEALINKPIWQQIIIILAGVFMNFLLAILIFSILFFTGVRPIGINTKIETNLDLKLIPTYSQALESGLLKTNPGLILSPKEGSIAEISGIKTGDIIYEVFTCDSKILKNGKCESGENKKIISMEKAEDLMEIINKSKGKSLAFNLNSKTLSQEEIIQYGQKDTKGKIVIVNIPKEGIIGVYINNNITLNKEFEYKYGIIGSIKNGIIETYSQSLLTLKGLNQLITHIISPKTPDERTQAINQVSGPIGIVDFISSSIGEGFIFILLIGAIISINLGIFNLLPIPALDGGRFIFILINAIFIKIFGKKAINENIEGLIHVLFFIFLIALSLIIAYNDINKLI